MLQKPQRERLADCINSSMDAGEGGPEREAGVLACRYVYNKIDVCSVEEVDAIARMPNSIPCSAFQELNMDGLLERMWDMMALVRAYTKKVPPHGLP